MAEPSIYIEDGRGGRARIWPPPKGVVVDEAAAADAERALVLLRRAALASRKATARNARQTARANPAGTARKARQTARANPAGTASRPPTLSAGTGPPVMDGDAWKRWVSEGVGCAADKPLLMFGREALTHQRRAPFDAAGRFDSLRHAADEALQAAAAAPTRASTQTIETLKVVLHVLTHGGPGTAAAPRRAPVEQPHLGAGLLLCGAVLLGAASAIFFHRSRAARPTPVPQVSSPARERPPAAPERQGSLPPLRPGPSPVRERPGPSPARERPGPSPARERPPSSLDLLQLPPRPLPSPRRERPPAAATTLPAVMDGGFAELRTNAEVSSPAVVSGCPAVEPQLASSSSFLAVDDPLNTLAALTTVPEHSADAVLQAALRALPTAQLAAALAALPASHAAAALACLPASAAGAALAELAPEMAGTILVACETSLGVEIVAQGLSHRTAAMAIAYAQPAAAAATLLAAMNTGLRLSLMGALQLDEDGVVDSSPLPLSQLSPHAAADLLSVMDSGAAAEKIAVLTEPDIAAVLSCLPLEVAAAIMCLLPAAQCAAVLAARGGKAASCALEAMNMEAAALVLKAMPPAMSMDILAAMPSRPRQALLARLPSNEETPREGPCGEDEELALALQRLATVAEGSDQTTPSHRDSRLIPAFEI